MSNTDLQSYEAQLAQEAEKVKATLGAPSTNKVSTKGKMFTLPDGTTNPGPMSCVILDYNSFNSWYKGVYDPSDPKPPVCWALNKIVTDLTPSTNCPEPQAERCEPCAKNQFGSEGRGKACKNRRRLLIAPVTATPETKPMVLEVSPAAIRVFDNFVLQTTKELGVMPIQVIVDIGFDASKAYPSLTFENARLHSALETMMSLRAAGQEILALEPTPEA